MQVSLSFWFFPAEFNVFLTALIWWIILLKSFRESTEKRKFISLSFPIIFRSHIGVKCRQGLGELSQNGIHVFT